MNNTRRFVRARLPLLVALALGSSVIIAGCAGRARYYDPDARDYHRWDQREVTFYVRWESDGHREHREFTKRAPDEQKAYWRWRHEHRA